MAPAPVSARSPLKPVEWIGSALDDLRELPEGVEDEFGYALHEAQRGKHHPSAKQLKGDLRGLIELVDDFDGDTYRDLYGEARPRRLRAACISEEGHARYRDPTA